MKCLDGKDGEGMGIGLPDGLQLVWNNRLRNTAGRASWKSYVDDFDSTSCR